KHWEFRVRCRDHWVNAQLVAQATILALTYGISLANVQAPRPMADVAIVAAPVALLMAYKYVVQDRVIGQLQAYLKGFTDLEAELSRSDVLIYNFLASREHEGFRSTVGTRFHGQILAFVIVPAVPTVLWAKGVGHWDGWTLAGLAFAAM